MNDDEAILTEASEIWWRESDGCGPVTDAEGEGDEGLFGAPDTGWQYMTIEFRGYLVSPDGETVIAVSELDPPADIGCTAFGPFSKANDFSAHCNVDVMLTDPSQDQLRRDIADGIFKILQASPKTPFTESGMALMSNVIRERLAAEAAALVYDHHQGADRAGHLPARDPLGRDLSAHDHARGNDRRAGRTRARYHLR